MLEIGPALSPMLQGGSPMAGEGFASKKGLECFWIVLKWDVLGEKWETTALAEQHLLQVVIYLYDIVTTKQKNKCKGVLKRLLDICGIFGKLISQLKNCLLNMEILIITRTSAIKTSKQTKKTTHQNRKKYPWFSSKAHQGPNKQGSHGSHLSHLQKWC